MNEKSARKLQLSRRIDGIHPAAAWSIRVASIVFALIVGGLLLLALGYSPLKAYGTIIDGSLGSKTFVRQTIKIAIPLLGCALAIAPCFKMHFWNIGAEGQITAGAIGATFFALKFGKTIPQLPLLLIMAVAAILCGGLWALIPAFFKAKWNTNETLFTLMMNYIIIGVVKWLQGGPWEAPPSRSQMIAQFAGNAKLPSVLGVHCGWIIVLVLTVLMFIYMRYTKHGYEIAVIGDSSNTARYAGMNVGRIMMRTMFLSGSISGLSASSLSPVQTTRFMTAWQAASASPPSPWLAGSAQSVRDDHHRLDARRADEGLSDAQHPHAGALDHRGHPDRLHSAVHAGLRVLHQLQDFRPSGKGGLRYGRCSDISFHAVRFLGRQRHAAALRHAR